MAEELKSRSEMDKKYTWNLKDLYKSEADWSKDVDKVKDLTEKVAKYDGKSCASAKNLLFVLV